MINLNKASCRDKSKLPWICYTYYIWKNRKKKQILTRLKKLEQKNEARIGSMSVS